MISVLRFLRVLIFINFTLHFLFILKNKLCITANHSQWLNKHRNEKFSNWMANEPLKLIRFRKDCPIILYWTQSLKTFTLALYLNIHSKIVLPWIDFIRFCTLELIYVCMINSIISSHLLLEFHIREFAVGIYVKIL